MNLFTTLPPSEKRRQYELRALALRDFARLAPEQALDPFALARFAKLLVVDFDSITGLSAESREHLLGTAADQWSGGACSQPLPSGWRIVILNPAHGIHRNRATLMEEIAHVFLGHKPNRLAVVGRSPSLSKDAKDIGRNPVREGVSKTLTRDYNHAAEEAAYAVGSAALLPYFALRHLVFEGRDANDVARRFRVSRQLVEYRIKVTHLWPIYKDTSTSRNQHV